jgi:hypothetical protein
VGFCPKESRLALDVQDSLNHIGLILVYKACSSLVKRIHRRHLLLNKFKEFARSNYARFDDPLIVSCVTNLLAIGVRICFPALSQVDLNVISLAQLGFYYCLNHLESVDFALRRETERGMVLWISNLNQKLLVVVTRRWHTYYLRYDVYALIDLAVKM